jgi:uroporphyrinogen decarboxylase
MEPKFLKEEFGDDITFWGGGADTRNVITRKSPEDVKKHITELLEIFTPGGGYIWNTVHNILPDVPPENIVAMFEALQEYNEKI